MTVQASAAEPRGRRVGVPSGGVSIGSPERREEQSRAEHRAQSRAEQSKERSIEESSTSSTSQMCGTRSKAPIN